MNLGDPSSWLLLHINVVRQLNAWFLLILEHKSPKDEKAITLQCNNILFAHVETSLRTKGPHTPSMYSVLPFAVGVPSSGRHFSAVSRWTLPIFLCTRRYIVAAEDEIIHFVRIAVPSQRSKDFVRVISKPSFGLSSLEISLFGEGYANSCLFRYDNICW